MTLATRIAAATAAVALVPAAVAAAAPPRLEGTVLRQHTRDAIHETTALHLCAGGRYRYVDVIENMDGPGVTRNVSRGRWSVLRTQRGPRAAWTVVVRLRPSDGLTVPPLRIARIAAGRITRDGSPATLRAGARCA